MVIVFQTALIVTTFLCSMVAGFLLAFLLVIMPGIGNLSDKDFIKSFQAIDKIIQDGQPIFIFIWVGSILVIILTAIVGMFQLNGMMLFLIIAVTSIYIIGVQLPTILINVPLNNKLQSIDIDNLYEEALLNEREKFETRWNKWNFIRTAFACLTSFILIGLVFNQTNLGL